MSRFGQSYRFGILIAVAGAGLLLLGAYLGLETVRTEEIAQTQYGATLVPTTKPAPTALAGIVVLVVGFALLLLGAAWFNVLSSRLLPRIIRYGTLLSISGFTVFPLGIVFVFQRTVGYGLGYSNGRIQVIPMETQARIASLGIPVMFLGVGMALAGVALILFNWGKGKGGGLAAGGPAS